jgi:membrane protein involved in colicin uptake
MFKEDDMKNILCSAIVGIILFFLLITGSMLGCKGSDTREKVDDVVEEAVGKKNVERMQQMKKDIDHIKKEQKERLKQMNPEEE